MPKYIKKKDLKRAIDECQWYHINKNSELVSGASTYDNAEPLYKASDIINIIYNLPTKKIKKTKHKGKWIKHDIASYCCSKCGKIQIADDTNELNYCCCCGSKNKIKRIEGADDE